MKDTELVKVAMNHSDRLKLYGQISAQCRQLGIPLDYQKLGLGFEVSADWPVDQECELTVVKLVALAFRLGMRIEITDLNFVPINKD